MGQAIYSARVEDIAAVVSDITWPTDTLMILERLPLSWLDPAGIDTGLRFERFELAAPFNQYERGRIFHEAGELRWEKIDHQFWTVFVGRDDLAIPAVFGRDPLELTEPESRTYYLWGKRLSEKALTILGEQKKSPVFAEFTVGGILKEYPAPPPADEKLEQLVLDVAEYIDPTTRQLRYYRFKGVSWR
jgi:hypothetical protein